FKNCYDDYNLNKISVELEETLKEKSKDDNQHKKQKFFSQKFKASAKDLQLKMTYIWALFAFRFTLLTGIVTITAIFQFLDRKMLYSLETYFIYVSIDHTCFNQIIKKHYNLEYRLHI
ncbi:hypothetical protein RFI_04630, partial [Reticulomyxa filosa]